MSQQPNLSALIWSVADLLRGDFKAHEYGRVILPFTVLRRYGWALQQAVLLLLWIGRSLGGKRLFGTVRTLGF